MKTVKPSELSQKENYKFLIGSVIPRPIAMITTLNSDAKVNVAPFSFFNIVSSEPAILSVAIQRKAGKAKDTTANLMRHAEAVIHIVDTTILEEVNKTAAELLPNDSELDLTDFTLTASKTIKVPGIKQARIRFETTVHQHIPVYNESKIAADLFLLKIEQYYIEDTLYHEGKIDQTDLQPVSRLAGDMYAEIGKIFELVRPRG